MGSVCHSLQNIYVPEIFFICDGSPFWTGSGLPIYWEIRQDIQRLLIAYVTLGLQSKINLKSTCNIMLIKNYIKKHQSVIYDFLV